MAKRVYLLLGFRDIFFKLSEKYHLDPKIPSCQQLEQEENEFHEEISDDEENDSVNLTKRKKNQNSKQLSVRQTNESRKNTKVKHLYKYEYYFYSNFYFEFYLKCRFIIEKQNGTLKNHKKLDNIRNTEIGHVQIDYRIACAMDNFLHKHCCPDGDYAQEVARRIRIKAQFDENKLAFLLNRQLGTSLIPTIELEEIKDFPIIKRKTLKRKIFMGTFQLKQSKSYLEDLVERGNAYIVSKEFAKGKENIADLNLKTKLLSEKSKIIAVTITSRHKRGKKTISLSNMNSKKAPEQFKTTYKIFVHYVPNVNSYKSIKSKLKIIKSILNKIVLLIKSNYLRLRMQLYVRS